MIASSRSNGTQGGFTLVEVLLVVFIVGLAAGVAVLSVPQRAAPAQSAARAFADTLRSAQDQAILTGQPIGLRTDDTSYALVTWRRETWQPASAVAHLPRKVTLERDEPRQPRPGTADLAWPQLIFDPSGVVVPVQFTLRAGSARFTVEITDTGEVQLDQP